VVCGRAIVALRKSGTVYYTTVSSLSGLVASFSPAVDIAAGTAHPTVVARAKQDTSLSMLGAGVVKAGHELEVVPALATPWQGVPWSGLTYSGRPVMQERFNWAEALSLTVSRAVVQVDFDTGAQATNIFTDRHERKYSGTVLLRDRSAIEAFVGLFCGLRGSEGTLWLPAPESLGTILAVTTIDGDSVVTLEGTSAAEEALGDGLNRIVSLNYFGLVARAEIRTAATSGGNSVLRLVGLLPNQLLAGEGSGARWLYLSRFTDDELTLSYITTTVATANVSFTALKVTGP
jgi:hypothetical protein